MSIIYTILREDYKNDVNVPNVPKFSYPPLFLKTLKADFKISSSSYQLMLSHPPPPPKFPFSQSSSEESLHFCPELACFFVVFLRK